TLRPVEMEHADPTAMRGEPANAAPPVDHLHTEALEMIVEQLAVRVRLEPSREGGDHAPAGGHHALRSTTAGWPSATIATSSGRTPVYSGTIRRRSARTAAPSLRPAARASSRTCSSMSSHVGGRPFRRTRSPG